MVEIFEDECNEPFPMELLATSASMADQPTPTSQTSPRVRDISDTAGTSDANVHVQIVQELLRTSQVPYFPSEFRNMHSWLISFALHRYVSRNFPQRVTVRIPRTVMGNSTAEKGTSMRLRLSAHSHRHDTASDPRWQNNMVPSRCAASASLWAWERSWLIRQVAMVILTNILLQL